MGKVVFNNVKLSRGVSTSKVQTNNTQQMKVVDKTVRVTDKEQTTVDETTEKIKS